jgi:Lar family restriction alleviation protein
LTCKFFCGTYHIVADKFAESKFFSGQPVSIPTTSQEIKRIAMSTQHQPNTVASQATPELKPCPFCGSVPRLLNASSDKKERPFFISCAYCGVSTACFPSDVRVAAMWNKRSIDEEERAYHLARLKREEDHAFWSRVSKEDSVFGRVKGILFGD